VEAKLAILLDMSIPARLSLAEAKNRLSEVVDEVERQHARVTITKHGRPAAILISPEDLEALEETLELLGDPEAMARIRASRAESDAGDVMTLSKQDALAQLRDSE
jgi:prevent-host-death family protein